MCEDIKETKPQEVEKHCWNCGTICEGMKDIKACAYATSDRANWTPIAVVSKA